MRYDAAVNAVAHRSSCENRGSNPREPSRIRKSRRGYAIAVALLLALGMLAGTKRVPFTPGFKWVAVAYFSSLIALPWLATRFRIGCKIAGFSASLGVSLLVPSWCLSASASPADASTVAILAISVHFLLLTFLVRDAQVKSAVLVQNLSVIYAVPIWLSLQNMGIVLQFGSSSRHLYDARFLIWPPFLHPRFLAPTS